MLHFGGDLDGIVYDEVQYYLFEARRKPSYIYLEDVEPRSGHEVTMAVAMKAKLESPLLNET